MEGWIKIHRKFTEWEWYKDSNTKCLFLHLVLKANLESKDWKGIVVQRGQLATSLTTLQKETGLTIRAIRTGLKRLTKCHTIDTQSDTRFTIITICNYDNYQYFSEASDTRNDKQVTHEVTTTKEEYILSSSTTSTVRAREGLSSSSGVRPDGIDGDISMLRGSPSWLEQIMMRHKVTEPDLDVLFGEFAAECRCNGLERHVDINDAKRHFNNWLRIYIRQQRNQNGTKDRGHRPSASENIAAAQREELERTAALLRGSEGGD